jgi:adenosylhomocysteinase
MAGSGSGSATSSLRRNGIEVIGEATTDQAEHETRLKQVLAARPDMLLDNSGDLFVTYLTEPYPGLLGGTVETTSGRMRLQRRAAELKVPVLVINDNPIKQVAENRHAVGQSVPASFLRIIDLMTNGRCVASSATAPAAKDIAANFRNAYATVCVVEVDPVDRLEASLDGFAVPAQQDAHGAADIVITANCRRVGHHWSRS